MLLGRDVDVENSALHLNLLAIVCKTRQHEIRILCQIYLFLIRQIAFGDCADINNIMRRQFSTLFGSLLCCVCLGASEI